MKTVFSLISLVITLLLYSCEPMYKISAYNTYEHPINIKIYNDYVFDAFITPQIDLESRAKYTLIIDSIKSLNQTLLEREEDHLLDSLFNITFLNHVNNTNRPDTLFTFDDFVERNYLIDSMANGKVYLNLAASINEHVLKMNKAVVSDTNDSVLETIYYSTGLMMKNDGVIFPFQKNTFRNDKAYESYVKYVENDWSCLKYIEIQELYNTREYEMVIEQINNYNFEYMPLENSRSWKNSQYQFQKEQNFGILTIGILASYKIGDFIKTKDYWSKLCNRYSYYAWSLILFDSELNTISNKLNLTESVNLIKPTNDNTLHYD